MKKLLIISVISVMMFGFMASVAFAVVTPGAEVKNENANANACWGMDRAFYADGSSFKEEGGNMDIKRSFDPADGKVGEQRAAWVEKYCEPHGPQVEE